MNLFDNNTDSAIADIGHRTAQTGAVATLFGWIASSQGTAVLGIAIGVIGLCIQWYYRRRQDKREQAEFERRMGQGE